MSSTSRRPTPARFFRFSDTYPKIFGGEMWVAMDPPTGDPRPQEGILNIRDFTCPRRAGARSRRRRRQPPPGAPASAKPGVEFSRMRVEFTRTPGRFTIREGIVKGPVIGATTEGYIDYLREDVRLRGTFVPFFGLNNMFGQIPIFGLFLGGGTTKGWSGITYEVVGPPGSVRCCGSIRSRRWRPGCCASSSNFRPETERRATPIRFVSADRKRLPSRSDRSSHRLQQHVPLLAERQLDDALRRELRRRERHLLIGHSYIVDLEAAALDLTARFAI